MPSATVNTVTATPAQATDSLAILLPGEPVPVRLMNTVWADRNVVYDALETAENLRRWLADVDPDGEYAPDDADLARFRTLRDALRRLAALSTSDTRPAAASATTDVQQAVDDVNDAVEKAPSWTQLTYRDGELHAAEAGQASPIERTLSSIASQSIPFLTEDMAHLRACYGPGCVLYFIQDRPRREWCSNACGNRARVARHYQRHRKSQ